MSALFSRPLMFQLMLLCICNRDSLGDAVPYNRRSFLEQVTYEPDVRAQAPLEPKQQGELELHLREAEDFVAVLDFQIWPEIVGARVFNPHHHTLTNESYNVAVFDEKQNHVGNLYPDINSGSFRGVGPGDWVKIDFHGGVCTRILMKSRRVHRPWKAEKYVLPPGKYEVQVIANSMMFAPPPLDLQGKFDDELAAQWPKGRVIQDAWRSNRVTIEIKPEHPIEPPPKPKRERPPE